MSPYSRMSARRRAILTFGIPVGLFVAMLSLVLVLIVLDRNARQEDRVVARYVLCRELESVKRAQRVELAAKIKESRQFLEENPGGIPGLDAALIRRGIERNEMLRRSLAPYPRGCAAFARDPARLNVTVPELKE